MDKLIEKFSLESDSCICCKWLHRRMIKSGRNPIYDNYCNEPSKRDRFYQYSNVPGEWIGEEAKTPKWCPLKRKSLKEKVDSHE